MLTTIQKSIALMTKLSLLVAIALLTQQTDAQVVPYRVNGTGLGNLEFFTAAGEARGLHFGRLTYAVDTEGVDIQVASDGSTLELHRVGILLFQTSEPDSDGNVVTTIIDEWEIQGGTKRFRRAAAVPNNNIISTAVTDPYDPNGDLTAIPFVFQKLGRIDLGRRR